MWGILGNIYVCICFTTVPMTKLALFKKNFYFYFILLYNTVLVLPYIDINPPRVYMSSQSWTPFPSASPYHLSGSSQCTSPKHPVSCIEPGLAIRFVHDIIHVSMPFSQIIPPSPSPTESNRLFYTSVSLLLSRIQSLNIKLRMCSLSSSTVSLLCFSVSISKMGIPFLTAMNNL